MQNFVVIDRICYEQKHYKFYWISNSIKISLVGRLPGDADMRQWIESSLIETMVYLLFGAMPLHKPALAYGHLDPLEKNLKLQ